jgi:hypothetical protein
MVVAFHFPHNEGVVYGVFTEPDRDTDLLLVDLYEVDGRIRTFADVESATAWLNTYPLNGTPVEPNKTYNVEF